MHEMMWWLAQAASELRTAQGRKQVHIAAEADIDQSTVNRFERGESQPANIDRLVAAYADDLEMPALAIWEHALELWRANAQDDRHALEQDELAATPQADASAAHPGPSARNPRRTRRAR